MDTPSFHSDYMRRVYDIPDIAGTFRLLRDNHADKLTFDTLVGTGLSGSIVVPQLARMLRKKWLVVRKQNDGSHSYFEAEGDLGRQWMFVDDMVASGKTRRRVVETIQKLKQEHDFTSQLVATFLYQDGELSTSVAGFNSTGSVIVKDTVKTIEWDLRGKQCQACWHYRYKCECDEFDTPVVEEVEPPQRYPSYVPLDPWGTPLRFQEATLNAA